MTKWTPIVRVNREAPTLVFKGPQNDVPRTSTTAALTAKFEPETGMEAEVAAMLKAAGLQNEQEVEEAEQELALQVWMECLHTKSCHFISSPSFRASRSFNTYWPLFQLGNSMMQIISENVGARWTIWHSSFKLWWYEEMLLLYDLHFTEGLSRKGHPFLIMSLLKEQEHHINSSSAWCRPLKFNAT